MKSLSCVRAGVWALTVPLAAGGCGVEKPPRSGDGPPLAVVGRRNPKVDVLFTMADFLRDWLPAAVASAMPNFVNALQRIPGGLPDLQLGVASASMGAGAFTTVSRCEPGTPGNREGKLQVPARCAALAPGERFVRASANESRDNFSGGQAALADLVSCLVSVGGEGCAFQHPFAAARRALEKAGAPDDPDNGGFLRPDANLMLVVVANVDDCSVPADSTLFDPSVNSVADPSGLGVLDSYRCAEFGHLCNGVPPPHFAPAARRPLVGCVSAEGRGRLTPVAEFVNFVRSLKPGHPESIAMAAITGPSEPYAVEALYNLPSGGVAPGLSKSCDSGIGANWGSPGVRIHQAARSFGGGGAISSVCADDFGYAMINIASMIGRLTNHRGCLDAAASTTDDVPDCRVVEQRGGAGGVKSARDLAHCDAERTVLPCWDVSRSPPDSCINAPLVCHEGTCSPDAQPEDTTVSFHCRRAIEQ